MLCICFEVVVETKKNLVQSEKGSFNVHLHEACQVPHGDLSLFEDNLLLQDNIVSDQHECQHNAGDA